MAAVASQGAGNVEEPFDLIRMSLDEVIRVKCRHGRELRGKLHAYDQHLNMVLSDATETIIKTSIDEETYEEVVHSEERSHEMLFVRGDAVILIAPPLRTA